MSLDTFQQRVSRAIKRGKVFDKDIPSAAKDALTALEDLHDWKHMRRMQVHTLLAGTNEIEIPFMKNCRSCRWLTSDGATVRVHKVNEENVISIDDDVNPVGFWVLEDDEDTTVVYFDAKPTEDLDIRMVYYLYSQYEEGNYWLRSNRESIWLAQTMIELAPVLKDPRIVQNYAPVIQVKTDLMKDAQTQADFDGQDNRMVPYMDEIENYLQTGTDWDV